MTPPPDFLTTPSTPLKRICQKTPRTPPPLDFQLLCIYETNPRKEPFEHPSWFRFAIPDLRVGNLDSHSTGTN